MLRLLLALSHRRDDVSEEAAAEIALRLDVFWSRVALLEEGWTVQHVAAYPHHEALLFDLKTALAQADDILARFEPGDTLAVENRLAPFVLPLRRLSQAVIESDGQNRAAAVERAGSTFLFVELTFAGIFALGLAVAWIMIRQVRINEVRLHERNQAEAALHESEARFRSVFEESPIAAALATPDGKYIRVNGAFCELLGYQESELVGQPFLNFTHPEDRERNLVLRQNLGRDSKHTFEMEKRYLRKDGQWIWVDLKVTQVRDASGQDIYTIGQHVNITERKRVEEALRESELNFRNLIEGSLQGIVIHDGNRPLFVNRALADMFGYDSSDQVEDLDILVAPHDRERLQGYRAERILGRDAPSRYEFEGIRRDGEPVHVSATARVVNWQGRRTVQVALLDVTERVRAERALQESEEAFRDIIEGSLQGSYVHENSRLLFVNRALAEIFGYGSAEELMEIGDLSCLIDPEDLPRMEGYRERRQKGEPAPSRYEFTGLRKDGSRITLDMTVRTVNWHGQQAIQCFVLDVTANKRAEEDLRTAMAAVENASRAKSEFLSSMSHELRTPMNAILGFAQLLESGGARSLDDRQRRFVSQILTASRHLLSLIDEVLDLTRIEAGSLQVNIETVAPGSIIGECVELTCVLAEERFIRVIDKTAEERMPPILADGQRFRQVLLNLLSNAIKYNCDDGFVVIGTEKTDGANLRLIVQDSGPSIPESAREQIFEPFHRLTSTGNAVEGTGVGLTISKRLIGMMNGGLGFRSVEGEGSTFWIDLPISEFKVVEVGSGARPLSPAASKDVDGGDEGKTVLYVEDNPANLALMEEVIGMAGKLRMISAHTAELGLQLARTQHPDLILMDLNLPGMNGVEALHHLRDDPSTGGIPVIALTAHAMRADIARGLEAGFDAYLSKPIDVSKILSTVRGALKKSSSPPLAGCRTGDSKSAGRLPEAPLARRGNP